ncbi:ABC transporter substrate-binding protein [Paenibacillus sp. FSL R7-0273]|uniref:ABC transporter substrate-binding protein n=1 Tax=Paenibacillus sp. FSL R7-0273 TaxID=1536772 RepID=UPI0004F935CF|nr:extracellular solute-binding protein [Paenibacillus sp. FSL R7-0273]AIQ48835.1 ABC transporter substrate-binding protein [Paenibacillus sp. FSL R7-0273]OMF91286.1 ABC transporter substrate-binding protein [Paenibacillus sp. FSL R7-0273]
MRKKGRKSFLAIALTMAVAMTTACGNSNNSAPNNKAEVTNAPETAAAATTAPAAGTGEKVTLSIVWWGSQARHDATLKALDKYKELNPNVTFETQFSGWDGYFDKLAVQFSAKSAPDIIQMDAAYLNDYAGRGLLADLKDVNVDSIEPVNLDGGKVNNTQYAMPLGVAALGMVYDKTVVDKLGLEAPTFGWTWDDYFAFGEAAKAKLGEDKYVYADQSADLVDYTAYQYSMGKGYIFDDQGKLSIDKDTWVGFMTKMNELRDKGILTPADITTTDKELDPQLDSVVNGTAIARHSFSNLVGSIDSLKPDTYEFASMPYGSEAGGWLKPGMFWSVNAQSAHQAEAVKFVDWFVNNEEAGTILGLTRGMPINSKVVETLTPTFSESDKTSLDFLNKVTPDAQKFINDPQGWGSFKNDYKSIVEKLQFEQSTPEEAYEELTKLAEQYAVEASK